MASSGDDVDGVLRRIDGLVPLLVEAAVCAARCGLKHEFAAGGERGAQSGERLCGVAGPSGDLTAVQVLHGEAAAGVPVRCGEDAELAVERGEAHGADICNAALEHAFLVFFVQTIPEALHGLKDRLGRLTCVRDHDGEGAGLRDGLEEEAACDPGGDSHLPGLEDDVALLAVLLKGHLRRVGAQIADGAFTIADTEMLRGPVDRWPVVCSAGRFQAESTCRGHQAVNVRPGYRLGCPGGG